MGQEKLYGLYWLLISGGWWTERQCDRRDKRNCVFCTDYWLVVGGELRGNGTDGTKVTVWFVLIIDWWWVVNWETVGQMEYEKLYGFYWLVIGGGCWTER
jgi:hypothetical protein